MMGMRLYIDVETYRKRDKDVFVREKVIAIGVIEDWTPYRPESSAIWSGKDVTFHYFTEWSLGGEPEVILAFYDYLYNIIERDASALASITRLKIHWLTMREK